MKVIELIERLQTLPHDLVIRGFNPWGEISYLNDIAVKNRYLENEKEYLFLDFYDQIEGH